MNYTAVLVDDEMDNNLLLQRFLNDYCPQIKVVEMCETFNSAYNSIKELNPDIIFLDIKLGATEDSFQLLDILKEQTSKIIFITAYEEYALKAFRYKATDYLTKPIKISELIDAVEKVCNELNLIKLDNEQVNLEESIISNELIVKTKNNLVFLKQDEILFIESYGKLTLVHTKDEGQLYETLTPIGVIQEKLNDNFKRVHKSFIANLSYVTKIEKKGTTSFLIIGNKQCPLSRRNKKEILTSLGFDGSSF